MFFHPLNDENQLTYSFTLYWCLSTSWNRHFPLHLAQPSVTTLHCHRPHRLHPPSLLHNSPCVYVHMETIGQLPLIRSPRWISAFTLACCSWKVRCAWARFANCPLLLCSYRSDLNQSAVQTLKWVITLRPLERWAWWEKRLKHVTWNESQWKKSCLQFNFLVLFFILFYFILNTCHLLVIYLQFIRPFYTSFSENVTSMGHMNLLVHLTLRQWWIIWYYLFWYYKS